MIHSKSIVLILAIAILLVGSTVVSHSAEAKKRKPSEIKVYVKNVEKIDHKLLLKVCSVDDDDCFGKIKTVDLQKYSGDKMAMVTTYHLTFSPNPKDLFAPDDVGACGKLNGRPTNSDQNPCADLQKVKSKHWKAVITYADLFERMHDVGDIRFD